jgi:3-oxoacyl-[acyl-carrier-protein] synthase II
MATLLKNGLLEPNPMTRVFITGLGAITPIGNDVQQYWQNLIAGCSGAARLTAFEPGDMPYNIACEVKDFDPARYMAPALAATQPRAAQFGIAAAKQALADADYRIDTQNCERVGVMMATGAAGAMVVEDLAAQMARAGWQVAGPDDLLNMLPGNSSTSVALATGARGPVMTHALACASSLYSILESYHYLQRGEADVMVAGGVESSISLMSLATFGRMGALAARTDDPLRACRPFSVDRDGLVFGEGGGALVLETEAHARGRGARLLAEVLGGKLTCDAYHVTAPDPNGLGAARAIRGALEMAHIRPETVGVVYAHGTGTPLNDSTEAMALRIAVGDAASKLKVTSIKSMVGHGFGAAGAQSTIAAVCTLQHGWVPPTINYTPDPAIDIEIVGNIAQNIDASCVIVNAFGFGGHNVVLALGRA